MPEIKLPEIKLPEGITDAQMQIWKKQHGKLLVVNVSDESDEYSVVFKHPNKDILSAVSLKAKKDEIEASLFLYTNCVLAEDEDVKTDDILKLMAANELGELLQSYRKRRKSY